MKRDHQLFFLRVFLLITASILTSSTSVWAKALTYDLEFSITPERACGPEERPCYPWTSDLLTYSKERHPIVPMKILRIALAPGEEVKTVLLDNEPAAVMDFEPTMAGRAKPFSLPRDPRPFVPRYLGGEYPKNWVGPIEVRHFRGYQLLEITIYPLHVTGGGKATFITKAKLAINTESTTDSAPTRGLMRDLQELNHLADEPLSMTNESDAAENPGYLILGPAAIIGNSETTVLRDFIAEKQARGINVFLTSLEETGAGTDTLKIRNYIRERYENDGVDFVLLVGAQQQLPWKKIRSGGGIDGDPVPSDQYYACLDGDFSNSQTYDWACEVAVGRVGVSSADQLAQWVNKTMTLRQLAASRAINKALNYGEKLDGSTLGGWVLDLLETGATENLETVGFPSTVSLTKLYDTFQQSQSANKFLETLASEPYYIVNHLGHANSNYVFRMNSDRIPELADAPGFFYSQGCYPNNADTNNWTIKATAQADRGPAAMISNTRYGWYQPGQGGEGTSALLHRAFWSMQFKNGIREIGKMNHHAKEAAVTASPGSLMRYTALESNLIGDPELDLGL